MVWNYSNWHLKRLINKSENWPDEGLPPTIVDGVTVYVTHRNLKGGPRRHRAHAICPMCGLHFPTGRLHQHLKVHK